MITNSHFLRAVFGTSDQIAHVTSFTCDPGNIPPGEHLKAWRGGYASQYPPQPGANQYFTISTFHPDEQGKARRRKALFRATHCIVLDDVREKLDVSAAQRLPRPSWILETSAGSEQWGYILTEPCIDRGRVENLLDGLVARGLAPDGRDPGMKGVTRYVRLPEGVNTKASKRNADGTPWQCRMLMWEPFNTTTMEQLAAPFGVDLDAERRDARVDGAARVDDHPLLDCDAVRVKEVRSDGRFDITCPWLDEHTNRDDTGTAVFTNADGTIGFKCHHGSCQDRTGRDLLQLIEQQQPGFGGLLAGWQTVRALAEVLGTTPPPRVTPPPAPVSFLDTPAAPPPSQQSVAPAVIQPSADAVVTAVVDELRRALPGSPEARQLAALALRSVEQLPKIEQIEWHKTVCDAMQWNQAEFKLVLKDLRASWYAEGEAKRAARAGVQPMDKGHFPDAIITEAGTRIPSTIDNTRALLDYYGIQARYDVIAKRVHVVVPGMVGAADNAANSAITHVISLAKLNELNSDMVPAYVNCIGDANQCNPVADWIMSRPWDGVDRLPALYATLRVRHGYDAALRDLLLRRWLLSAVAAALKPSGFHSRGVLTLVGPQSLGKTSWLRSLVDPALVSRFVKDSHILDPDNKDSVLTAVSHWLVELGELDGTFKRADIARLKGFITSGMDKLRRPYDRTDSEYPRRTVFFASVNDDHFLVDDTGNSRFWTVAVEAVDYAHEVDVQQVWAQVATIYQSGERWWLSREEEARLERSNEEHRAQSSIRDLLDGSLAWSMHMQHWQKQSASDVLRNIGFDKPTNAQAKEAAKILRDHGCIETKSKGVSKFLAPPKLF